MNSATPNSAYRKLSPRHAEATFSSFIVSLLATGLLTATLGLTGCNKGNDSTTDIDKAGTSATTEPKSDKAPLSKDDSAKAEPETVVGEASGVAGVPVRYNVESWNKDKVESVSINDVDKLKDKLGKVVTTDDNSLDYASNIATKYRFMKDDGVYLDLIDSPKYLELGWYYANPTDNDVEKATSISHAQKAYTFARQLMGDEGGKLVADMLGGQIIKSKEVGKYRVELAKCEFYSCMLILAKPSA